MRSARRSRRVPTSAATSSGRCWTTSSGNSDTRSDSGSCTSTTSRSAARPSAAQSGTAISSRTCGVLTELRRGINLAGIFDRRDDRPGRRAGANELAAIADAGFTAVRVPVRWWDRVDELLGPVGDLVEQALRHRLAVVLTMHHADAVYEDPHGSAAALTALLRSIAAHFAAARGAL